MEIQTKREQKLQGHLLKYHETLTHQKYLTRRNFGISTFLTRKFE